MLDKKGYMNVPKKNVQPLQVKKRRNINKKLLGGNNVIISQLPFKKRGKKKRDELHFTTFLFYAYNYVKQVVRVFPPYNVV